MTSKSRHKRNRVIKIRYRRLARKRAKPPCPPDEKDPPTSGDATNSDTPINPTTSLNLECQPSLARPQPNTTHSPSLIKAPHPKHKCRKVCRRRYKRLSLSKQVTKCAYRHQFYRKRGKFPYNTPINQSGQMEHNNSIPTTSKETPLHHFEVDNSLPNPSTRVDESIELTSPTSIQPANLPLPQQSTHQHQLNQQAFWLIGAYFRSIPYCLRSNTTSASNFHFNRPLTIMGVIRCAVVLFILTLTTNITTVTRNQDCTWPKSTANIQVPSATRPNTQPAQPHLSNAIPASSFNEGGPCGLQFADEETIPAFSLNEGGPCGSSPAEATSPATETPTQKTSNQTSNPTAEASTVHTTPTQPTDQSAVLLAIQTLADRFTGLNQKQPSF